MNLILFLGSGVSIPSGHPNAAQLTKNILSSKSHPVETNFLRCLKNYNEKAIKIGGAKKISTNEPVGNIYNSGTSYEDLYYLCEEIALFDYGIHNNAMVPAFIESFIDKFSPYLKGGSKQNMLLELGKLAHSTKKYINVEIIKNLSSCNGVKGLDLIVALAKNPKISSLNIITLNHDLLVEELLISQKISFVDGFGEKDGDVRWFMPDTFLSKIKVKLIKLHGSIDWFNLINNNLEMIGRVSSLNFKDKKNSSGKALQFLNNSPKILTGLNKTNYYNSGIYTDIHFHFQRMLYQNNLMVMSGYGWGDESINTRLMTWLDKKQENKLILLHQDIEELKSRSLILDRDYANWRNSNKLKWISKWLSETSEDEILDEPT
jgi:hypothetical protein